jgi:predicted enzyme related to lactoylglutathione lyase
MANLHGDFIWYELITPDADSAQAFYAPLLGWAVRSAGMPDMDYRLAATADGDVAGLMRMPDGMAMPPAWLGYVGVDDVDAMADAFRQGGGAVHQPPWDIPGVGRMALVADPQGAPLYVMKGAVEGGESVAFSYDKPRPGHCAWNELSTSDPAAAKAFYGARFGWVKDGEMALGDMGTYEFLRHTGHAPDGSPMGRGILGAVMPMMPGVPMPHWTFYFRVPDIDAAATLIGASGGGIVQPPIEIPGGDYSLVATDPAGAVFGLVGSRKG